MDERPATAGRSRSDSSTGSASQLPGYLSVCATNDPQGFLERLVGRIGREEVAGFGYEAGLDRRRAVADGQAPAVVDIEFCLRVDRVDGGELAQEEASEVADALVLRAELLVERGPVDESARAAEPREKVHARIAVVEHPRHLLVDRPEEPLSHV